MLSFPSWGKTVSKRATLFSLALHRALRKSGEKRVAFVLTGLSERLWQKTDFYLKTCNFMNLHLDRYKYF